MFSYFNIYKADTVGRDCGCEACATNPELAHAERYTDRHITTRQEATKYLNTYPDAVIIEFFTHKQGGFESVSYRNHSTGVTWQYNGKRWKKITQTFINKKVNI